MVQLKPKVVLKAKGESAYIPVRNLVATMTWTATVDLDLYAFYRAKKDIKPKSGFLGLGGVKPGQEGKIYYMSKGNLDKFPWMNLDQDAGVGDVGGQNEENLRIANLDEMEHVLIVANIFNKPNANFAGYDGRVTLKTGEQEIEVPLTATTGGSWCVIAHIDNSSPMGVRLININKVQRNQPKISEYVQS